MGATGQRILVIDDSPTLRLVVTGILERAGFEVVAVASGEHGLDVVRRGAFDLILVDFVMPKMNGFQFCRALRQEHEATAPPVALMSAKADKIRDRFVAHTGAVDAISKPFDARTLSRFVERALERARSGATTRPTAPTIPPADEAVSATTTFAGDLRGVSVGSVLQLLHMESASGVLSVESPTSEVRVVMRSGTIARAMARGAAGEFRLGRFLVKEGHVTQEDIERALHPSPDDSAAFAIRPRLGDALRAAGKISERELVDAISKQSSELIYEVLRWKAGRFAFRSGLEDTDQREPHLGLPVSAVIMEGFRRVDEWRLLEAKLGDFDELLVVDTKALEARGAKTADEETVLHALAEARSVRDIVTASHLSSFDACKIVCQLLDARLVRRQAA